MPDPKLASRRGSRNRRDASRTPEASKGGPEVGSEGGSKSGLSEGRRNLKTKYDTGSSSGPLHAPTAEPEKLLPRQMSDEIRTFGKSQIITAVAAEAVAKLNLDKAPASKVVKIADPSGIPNLAEFVQMYYYRKSLVCKEDEEKRKAKQREKVLLFLSRHGQGVKNTHPERKSNILCDLCGVDGHFDDECPYLDLIPKEVEHLPPAYSIFCKFCEKISHKERCPMRGRKEWDRFAVKKQCVNCLGCGHWTSECPSEPVAPFENWTMFA